MRPGLLHKDEPPAVTVTRPHGASAVLLACDHASPRLPRSLGNLGLTETQLTSHIAWDIGAAGVARRLSERLDATLVEQAYSRLVIDCNRQPSANDAIPTVSEWGDILANRDLPPADIAARREAVFQPYHDQLSALIAQRVRQPTILVSLHSFTPRFRGEQRPWDIGLMALQDRRLADVLLSLLRRDERLKVGDNEPYGLATEIDYTLPFHAMSVGLVHVGIEIRQDLIADEVGQKTWAGRLASLFNQAIPLVSR